MAAALSFKFLSIALLVVFTAIAPQQSAAIRPEHVAAAPTAPRNPTRIHPTGVVADIVCGLPFLPQSILDLCHSILDPLDPSPPSLTKPCRPSLTNKLVSSCSGFLTNSSVPEPPNSCCKGVRSFFANTSLPLCLCHVTNGNIGKLLPAPLIRSRTVELLSECHFESEDDADDFVDTCKKAKKYKLLPPMDKPLPPPPPPPEDDDGGERKA